MTRHHSLIIALSLILASCSSATARQNVAHEQSVASGQSVTNGQSTRPKWDKSHTSLFEKQWIHGTQDCETQKEPVLEIYQQDAKTYILRQSKCTSFEAPFMYVLMGDNTVLVLDTGASDDASHVPLYPTVQQLIRDAYPSGKTPNILVLHSHSHGDHYQGDAQFKGAQPQPNITIVGTDSDAIAEFFKFNAQQQSQLNLGNRRIDVLFTPGHQEEAITLYDHRTQWLLTGDSFYPGLVYVKHWQDYQNSLARIVAFGTKHPVSAVLGGHIEMQKSTGEIYPIGTLYQPNEAPLALSFDALKAMEKSINDANAKNTPREIKHENIIVMPMNWLQRSLSNAARAIFG